MAVEICLSLSQLVVMMWELQVATKDPSNTDIQYEGQNHDKMPLASLDKDP